MNFTKLIKSKYVKKYATVTRLFILSFDLLLTDIDECSFSLDNCHPNATCVNIDGSYLCRCDAELTAVVCKGKNNRVKIFVTTRLILFKTQVTHFCAKRGVVKTIINLYVLLILQYEHKQVVLNKQFLPEDQSLWVCVCAVLATWAGPL